MTSVSGRLRALVPACVFDRESYDALDAVYHAASGVLNVLTPRAESRGADTVACPIYNSVEVLPDWARHVLQARPQQLNRKDLLSRIVRTTHANATEATDAEAIALSQGMEEPVVAAASPEFCLYWEDDELRAVGTVGEFEVECYEIERTIFSRNTGILETGLMTAKRAVILGCGSVGSLVAAELARAGVGNFLLVDMDLLEYHNVCRHQCGVADVGRRKPDAVRDLVRNINPTAQVETCYTEVQLVSPELLETWCVPAQTIVFGCADNRGVDRYGNQIAAQHGVAFMSLGFWERAFAGEIFYWLPGCGHACYTCALGDGEALSGRVEANHHVYTSQDDLAAVNFEPGIAVDIDFVTIVGIKLALDIYNLGDPRFTQRLLPHLTQYTLVCNTNETTVGGELAEIFSYPLQVTTSIGVCQRPNCPICAVGE